MEETPSVVVTEPAENPWGKEAPPRGQDARWGVGDVLAGLGIGVLLSTLLSLVPFGILLYQAYPDLEGATEAAVTNPYVILAALAGLWAGFGGTVLYASRKKGTRSLGADFGLRVRWKTDLPLGIGVGLGLRVLEGVLLYLVQAAGVDVAEGAGNSDVLTDQLGNPAAFVAIGLAVALGAPFFEELFFRGLTLRAIMKRKAARPHRVAFAVVTSSLLFGVLHATPDAFGLVLWGATGLIGAVLAVLALKTRRLGASIIAHTAFNGSAVALVALGLA